MARGVVADAHNVPAVELITRDYEARGQAVLLSHMTVLAGHRPEALPDPPPTLVVWGAQDPGVPLAAHVELTLRCRGLLVPIADAAHLPYLEQREETVRWIRWAGQLAASRANGVELKSA
jgi:pimeloyl-ACP methyl ester carboxylesterase